MHTVARVGAPFGTVVLTPEDIGLEEGFIQLGFVGDFDVDDAFMSMWDGYGEEFARIYTSREAALESLKDMHAGSMRVAFTLEGDALDKFFELADAVAHTGSRLSTKISDYDAVDSTQEMLDLIAHDEIAPHIIAFVATVYGI